MKRSKFASCTTACKKPRAGSNQQQPPIVLACVLAVWRGFSRTEGRITELITSFLVASVHINYPTTIEQLTSATVVFRSHPYVGALDHVYEIISSFLTYITFDQACVGPSARLLRRVVMLERITDSTVANNQIVQQWKFSHGLEVAARFRGMETMQALSELFPHSMVTDGAINILISHG
ncbi:hypothetical protein PC121_g20764 [Phytophthora cactorum]|nr:hypothetical protein PC120_g21654 [Phytophthora cactorum]KAG3046299.1 hypothetical protein PC121_g20764 [Phytophthora cactorum]